MDRVGLTSYSDYMRCLAAKYNNTPPPTTIKADILPLLAAHGSGFPAAFSLPGLSLFNPFLASQASQASDSKPGAPVLPPTSNTSSSSSSSPPPSERLKRPKEDPLDLTDKRLKREERAERERERRGSSSTDEKRSPSPRSRPATPKIPSMADWSVEEVAEFVSKVDDCQDYAKVSRANLAAPQSSL